MMMLIDSLNFLSESGQIPFQNPNKKIIRNKNNFNISKLIRLPQILHDSAGVYVVPFQVNNPNFITNKMFSIWFFGPVHF